MLIIDVKHDEGIDKALKRYKKKYQRTQMHQQIRKREHFTKPSVERRNEILKAEYREKVQRDMNGD